jgi:hypothetical protein
MNQPNNELFTNQDASGTVDYKEFSYNLFGLGNKPALDVNAKNIVERVKAKILERGGVGGVHGVTRILKRMDRDGSLNLDKGELMEGLRDYGMDNISSVDMETLFG